MTTTNRLRAFYRRHADLYPKLYNANQRYSVMLRGRLKYVHEDDFHALPLLDIPAGAFCVDIGGNRGQSVTAIKSVLPDARIASFEPNPSSHAALANLAKRMSKVTTYNIGLGASDYEAVMFVPRCRGVVFDQLASTQLPDLSYLAKAIRGFGYDFVSQADLSFHRTVIEVKQLDWFRFAPDFIKIDVEGTELEVLKGAERTLIQNRPYLLIEGGERAEIEGFLSALGYQRYVYSRGILSPELDLKAFNHFYLNKARLALPLSGAVKA